MKKIFSHKTLISRLIGFISSLVFTLIACLIVLYPDFFHAGKRFDIFFLLILAVLQFIAQSICFLHVLEEKGPRWNLVVFLSTVSFVLIIVVFSIWIMNHLDYNMMPAM